MSMIQGILQELEMEAATTARVLDRVPNDKLAWKPHAKSMSLGQLAMHIATIPGAIASMAQLPEMPLPKFAQASVENAAQLRPLLDESMATARKVLGGMDDAALARTWRLTDGAREVMAVPVGGMLRMIMLNHWYHHRGQLSVYLRQLDIPLPSIYGPSADENPFVAK